MAVFIDTVIIAALVALGIIVGGAARILGFVVSRRPSHHTSTRAAASPVPPTVYMRPPEG